MLGVEVLSRYTDVNDRSTAFLFSDGAGAVVVGPSDVPAIGPTVWGSKPEAARVIEIDDWRGVDPEVGAHIHMDGREVYWLRRDALGDSSFAGGALEKALGMPGTVRNRRTVGKLAAKYNR